MDHSSISEINAGLVLARRISPRSVNANLLEVPYNRVVQIIQKGGDESAVTMEVGLHTVASCIAAAESIGEKDDLTKYLKMLEEIALRVEVGNKLMLEAKRLVQGENIDITKAQATLNKLDMGLTEFTTLDKVEPAGNMMIPTYFKPWDLHFGGVPKSGMTLVAAPPKCLTGDTIIEVNRGGRSFKLRLDQLEHHFNGGKIPHYHHNGGVWDPSIPTKLRSRFNDGSIRLNTLKGVWCNGLRLTFKLTLEDGRTLTGTYDHPILTPSGWVYLARLVPGDEVYVDGGQGVKSDYKYRWYTAHSVRNHPNACFTNGEYKVLHHRLVVEASMNDMSVDTFIRTVRSGNLEGLKFLDPDLIVHHIDGNNQNNSLENLQVMTQAQHTEEHNSTDHVMYHTMMMKVQSVEPAGMEYVYDVQMDEEPNNFLANSIVVHNTGKTTTVLQLVDGMTKQKLEVGVLSLEMPNSVLLSRWLELNTRLTKAQRSRVHISDGVYSIDEAEIALTRLITQHPELYCIFIDFADLMIPEKTDESTEIAGRIYRSIARVGKLLDKPIILLSQLNSNYVGGIPRVNHIRWSRLAEAVAGMVVLIFNPDRLWVDQGKDNSKSPLPYVAGKGYLILGACRYKFPHTKLGAIQMPWLEDGYWDTSDANWFPL